MMIAEHLILILLLTFSGNTRSGSMRPETRCVSTPWRHSAPYESNPTPRWTPTGITTTPCVSHFLPTITFSPYILQYVISACRILRDWSLITGRGGGYKTGGGAREVLPLRKGGGGGNSFSHSEGGHKTFRGSFYAVA